MSKTLFSGRKRQLSTWKGETVPCNLVIFPSESEVGRQFEPGRNGMVGRGLVEALATLIRRKGLLWLFLEGWEGDGEAILIKQDQMAASL